MPNIPRPFDPVLADKICERIATSSIGLVRICKEFEISTLTLYKWLDDENNLIEGETFQKRYARSKEIQIDILADETLAISDDGTNDTMTITMPNGTKKDVEDHEWVNRSRLRVDTRKFLIAKLNPKKYGDKVQVDQTVKQIPILNIDPLADDSADDKP